MGTESDFGQLRIRTTSEAAADTPAVPFNILETPDGGHILTEAGDARLVFSGTDWTERALTEFTDLADAITDIGATPTTLVLDAATNVSTAIVVPVTLLFRPAKGALLTKTGSGSIEFEGFGLLDAASPIPIFSGFADGDITWTGTEWPRRVSSELQYYAHSQLQARLKFVDAALVGKHCTFLVFPRTISGTTIPDTAVITEHHHVLAQPGDFPNSYDLLTWSPIQLESNTSWRSDPPYSARIHESSVSGNQFIIAARMMFIAGASGTCENIFVEDNLFIGNESQVGSSSASTVILGNVKRGGINRNKFSRTHGYNILGGYGTTGNFAENSTINDNEFIGCGTQVCAVINAKNFQIKGNEFDQKGTTAISTYTVIDVEPNTADGRVENGIIENNIMDCRETAVGIFVYGILVQATDVPSCKNITVKNNTIFGANLSISGDFNPLVKGIELTGCSEFYVTNNTIRSAFTKGISINQCRDGEVAYNHLLQCTDVVNDNACIEAVAVSDCDFHNNVAKESANVNRQSTGIIEHEFRQSVTATGTTITLQVAVLFSRFYDLYTGKTVTLNTVDYVATYLDTLHLSTTETIPTIDIETFVDANVTTGTDSITITAHGHLTGSHVFYAGTLGGVPTGFYFAIRVDANNLKLASTLALALAGTPVNITTASGGGTHTLVPIMDTKFSNNQFRENEAADGTTLVEGGSSVFTPLLRDYVPADHSLTLNMLPSGPVPSFLGHITDTPIDPVTWRSPVGITISGADNKQTKIVGADWDAGACSVEPVPVGGVVEETCNEPTIYKAWGLSLVDSNQHYNTIDYALVYEASGNVSAYKLGVYDGTNVSYTAGTKNSMKRVGSEIRVHKDASTTPWHTFTGVPTDALFVDTSIETIGATIGGVKITQVGNVEALTVAEVQALLLPAPGPIGGTTPDEITGTDIAATTSLAIGGGTALTKAVSYTANLTPASVAANVSAEESFTVTGLSTSDSVMVNGPGQTAGISIGNVRVSATNTLAILFVNSTGGSLTPSSGIYLVLAIRS